MRMFFIYGLEQQLALLANATITRALNIDSDADYLARYLSIHLTGDILIQITDNNTGQQWFNRQIHSANFQFRATGATIYPLPQTKLCKRASTVSFQITDVSGAPNVINIALHGYKQYGSSSPVTVEQKKRR